MAGRWVYFFRHAVLINALWAFQSVFTPDRALWEGHYHRDLFWLPVLGFQSKSCQGARCTLLPAGLSRAGLEESREVGQMTYILPGSHSCLSADCFSCQWVCLISSLVGYKSPHRFIVVDWSGWELIFAPFLHFNVSFWNEMKFHFNDHYIIDRNSCNQTSFVTTLQLMSCLIEFMVNANSNTFIINTIPWWYIIQ